MTSGRGDVLWWERSKSTLTVLAFSSLGLAASGPPGLWSWRGAQDMGS